MIFISLTCLQGNNFFIAHIFSMVEQPLLITTLYKLNPYRPLEMGGKNVSQYINYVHITILIMTFCAKYILGGLFSAFFEYRICGDIDLVLGVFTETSATFIFFLQLSYYEENSHPFHSRCPFLSHHIVEIGPDPCTYPWLMQC